MHEKERKTGTPIQSTLEIDEVRDVKTTLGPRTRHRAAENKAWEEDRRDPKLHESVLSCLLSGSPGLRLTSTPPTLKNLFSSYSEMEKSKHTSPSFR